MVAMQQGFPEDQQHDRPDEDRAAEAALLKQELALARREEEAHEKQRLLSARVQAVEAERVALKRRLHEAAAHGVHEAEGLLHHLPKLPAASSIMDRRFALEARREAALRREHALTEQNAERQKLLDRLASMRASFEDTRCRLMAAQALLDERHGREVVVPLAQEPEAPVPGTVFSVADPVVTLHDTRPPGAGPDDSNRRHVPRLQLDCEVGLETETNFFAGFGWDISSGGLFVACFEPMHVGQEVEVSFTLPAGPAVRAVCVVRWTRDSEGSNSHVLPGVGLQFLDLSKEGRAAVEHFVKQREPMFFPG